MPASRATAAASLSPPERRRSRRQPHVATAVISSPTGGRGIPVVLMDLSRHGVRLSAARGIASGTYQRLELAEEAQTRVREIRILSCREQDDGSFHVHAEFC